MSAPENGKVCFCFGHRTAPDHLLSVLIDEAERHVREFGVQEFVVGHYGAFDTLAARAVQAVKAHCGDVRLTLLLPYYPTARPFSLPDCFDGSLYPPIERVPKRLAIVCANRWMVDHSDFLISFVRYPGSTARELLEYARRRARRGELTITNL